MGGRATASLKAIGGTEAQRGTRPKKKKANAKYIQPNPLVIWGVGYLKVIEE